MPGPGGPMGGPRGPMGPMGPMGLGGMFFGGRTSSAYNRMAMPVYFGASRLRGASSGGTWAERSAELRARRSVEFRDQRRKHGTLKGTLVAFRGLTCGAMHLESCHTKLREAKKQLDEHKISQMAYNKRCLNAQKTYYAYLVRIGYIDENEYQYTMKNLANEMGMDYYYAPESGPGRSR